jgi:hypothetical protein
MGTQDGVTSATAQDAVASNHLFLSSVNYYGYTSIVVYGYSKA